MVPRLLEPGTIGQGKGDMKSVLATAGAAIHPFIYAIPINYIMNLIFEFLENENARAVFIFFLKSSFNPKSFVS
jgi:hypothetical protein